MPPSVFEAPWNAAWPPHFTENGHLNFLDTSTATVTSLALLGWKTHDGVTEACWAAQKLDTHTEIADEPWGIVSLLNTDASNAHCDVY
jgi:hypothetical protein